MLLKNEIRIHKLEGISIASAGTSAFPGNPADPKMVDYLLKMGVPFESHESKQLSKEDVDQADLILVMEKTHVKMIEQLWPEARDKMELLGKYISEDHIEDDVVDPYGGSSYHYRLAQSQITLAVRSLIKRLLSRDIRGQDAQNQIHSR